MKKSTGLLLYGFVFMAILCIDRVTKLFAQMVGDWVVIPHFLRMYLVYNRGVSWSFFHSDNNTVFMWLTFVIVLFIVIFFAYTIHRWQNQALILGEVMVLAGALSNVVDRFLYGGVIDFILMSYYSWSWPIFNAADVFIVMGLIIMVVSELFI